MFLEMFYLFKKVKEQAQVLSLLIMNDFKNYHGREFIGRCEEGFCY